MGKDPLAETLGHNVMRLRKRAGLTQVQLAEQLGLSMTFISRIERGEKFVSIKVLESFANYFSVSYDDLLRMPESNSGMTRIRASLEGHSPEYIKQIANIIAACKNLPDE